jgi:hypothetical protein
VNGFAFILAAKSWEIEGKNEIYVWKKTTDKRQEQNARHSSRTLNNIKTTIQVFMCIATVAFICQNIRVSVP